MLGVEVGLTAHVERREASAGVRTVVTVPLALRYGEWRLRLRLLPPVCAT